MKGPWQVLSVKGSLHIFHFVGLTQMKIIFGFIFGLYATKTGSRDSGDTKVNPHWVYDPSWSFNGHCHGPTILLTWPFIYWLCFCILCNKNGLKGLWGEKGPPYWVQDPPWSFNGPCHGPTIHQTWPFIYWLYFCILCNKNLIKGLWRHKGRPPLCLGSDLVLQWTLPWPYNTPNMALYISTIFFFAFYATKMGSRDSGDTKVPPHLVQDPPWSYDREVFK